MHLSFKLALHLLVAVFAVEATAQRYGYGGYQRRLLPDRSEFPMWENHPEYEEDVFTFARIRYIPHYRRGWDGDYPEADWNISYRLQQLTSLKVNPNPAVIELTDPELFDYPFIFIIAPRSVVFSDAEAKALRQYLLNGGFLMVDEFWGPEQWDHFYLQLKRVLPEYEPRELSLDHEIFHNIFDLREKPQVTAIHFWRAGLKVHPVPGIELDPDPHFYGIFDKKGRMMAILCHNNDLVDGWEREGEDIEFFKQYSEKFSFPMGINILFYAMTH
ncbi:MAG: DUF4159 domain-containing protein [Verrucomicrobiae bacterium]|nr:DUF4159 domain-containing protein [Verrucomicrobiae bacterium]